MLWENNIVGQTIRSVRKAKGMSTICKIAEAFDMRPSELVRKMEEAEEKRDK